MKFYPLTQSQLGIYLDWNADRDSIRYNIANDSIFPVGSIDVNRLCDALNKVLNNYCLFKLKIAEDICLLATTPDDMVVFHPYNTYSLDMGAVLGSLANCGKKIDFVSEGEFADKVDTLKNDPEHEKDLQGILHYAQRHLEGKKMTPVSNSWTTTVLYRLGFRWNPADDAYLSKFFDMLDTLGVFG